MGSCEHSLDTCPLSGSAAGRPAQTEQLRYCQSWAGKVQLANQCRRESYGSGHWGQASLEHLLAQDVTGREGGEVWNSKCQETLLQGKLEKHRTSEKTHM
ncbi:39S ribosomal protein L30, mitochondrial [Platysternon megacephalum]|uniref:39S ribosomal protein L30, mitochondrial n=1 Tax=Platysternon megacephalum TaxID=55544 RepID=A0A4D9EKC9_9SAUR|nr:39S ribosomal protein L30, mitochondrial [Platysternon megacephalum]